MGVFSGRRAKRKTKSLKKALGDYELPSFSGVVMDLLERIRDDDSSAASIAERLALDPKLSVRILATANSAAYGARQRVDDLTQAVAMLGMANLESLVLGVAVGTTLPRPSCVGFEAGRFWRTAAHRAAVGRALAAALHPASVGATFTAGLLQDMAVPLLAASRPNDYVPVLELYGRGEGELHALEREALGFDHPEIGAMLCETWNLPANLGVAVGAHHEPPSTVDGCPLAVSLVAMLRESDDDLGLPAFVSMTEACSGLSAETVRELVDESISAADELTELLR